MSTGQFALQSAIYSTLNNDSNLTSTLGAGVYDEVIEGSSYPFVSIGEDIVSEYGTKDLDGGEFTINIHVWSQYTGAKECKNIIDRIHDLLHNTNISVTGFNLRSLLF